MTVTSIHPPMHTNTLSGNEQNIAARMPRLLARACSRASIPYVLIGLALVIAISLAGREIHTHISQIESWITSLGYWGVLAFIVLFVVLTSCLLPDSVLCIIAGALFGFGWGLVAVVAGSLLSASVQYLLAQKLLRHRIENKIQNNPSLCAIQRAVKTDELRLQLLLRCTPLNPATISYILGATGVRFQKFILACLALTPGLALEVYFGHLGKHAARAAGSDSSLTHNLMLAGVLLAGLVVMYFISKMARTAIARAVAEAEAERATAGPTTPTVGP